MKTTHPDYCDCVECAKERLRLARARVASKSDGRKFVYRPPIADKKLPSLPPPEPRCVQRVEEPRYEEEYNGMNWFKEHLNWALFSGVLLGLIMLSSSAYYLPFEVFLVILAGLVILLLLVEIWYLRQKSRSLWFLLLNLLPPPFGLVVLLCLSNRSYYVKLIGRNEVLGPFGYIQEIKDWYNTRRDWRGVNRISVICPEE